MLIKIVAMFRNLLISSFDATTRKRAFHPAPASRGFASHVFLVKIEIITMVKTQNVMRTTVYIYIDKKNEKINIRTRELSQHVSAAYLMWDSPI